MSRMAALVALPVSLAELLEVRGRQGLTDAELIAVAVQTCRHVATLLETGGHVAAVPLRHVTARSLQLTGAGRVRLSHTELGDDDVYSVAAGDLQPLLQSLGEVLLSAAAETVCDPLTDLLTRLRDGHVTQPTQLTQLLSEERQRQAAGGSPGRPEHEVVALLHEELLGMSDTQPPQRSPSQLELTLNPSLQETAIWTAPPPREDSASVSHAGSFPEVTRSRAGEGAAAEGSAAQEESKISTSTELRNASCVVSGHFPGRHSPEQGRKSAASGATSAGNGHRRDLMLEKDMIRLMARQATSAENLATSTPNQSLVAPPVGATVAPPSVNLRRRRPVRRKPSALYGRRSGVGDRAFCGPEFVIRAREKPRKVELPQKSASAAVGSVVVVLLNGQKLDISCQPEQHTVADVTKAVFEEDPYPHPSLLGLAVVADGEFLFPPPATRLSKALVSPAGGRQMALHQRFKLYPAADVLPRSASGLHLLYLQLRLNLLENSLDVSSNQVVQLSSLALLAEFGGRSDTEDASQDYFLPEHYLPEPLTSQPELLRQLTEGHVTGAAGGDGGGAAAAERRFVALAASCRGYGRHRCSVDLGVKSYSTSTLSMEPSCLRLARCDPSGRSTARTLHWSTVAKVEYKQRSRRLVVSTAGAEALTFCGDKAKLRCLEYMLQQHLTSFREGLQLSSTAVHQIYRAKKPDPSSPPLTHYCVRTPLSSLTNRAAARRSAGTNHSAASPKLANRKAGALPAANQKSAPLQTANRNPGLPSGAKENPGLPSEVKENAKRCSGLKENCALSPAGSENTLLPPSAPDQTTLSPCTSRRRSAGGPLRQRGARRGAARWRSASQLAGAGRENSPPATGIRMGTRVPVSALQRQKLRSREALPHLPADPAAAYVIAAEIPPTPESALPPGVRAIDGSSVGPPDGSSSSAESLSAAATFNVTVHRCPRTGGLGVRVLRTPASGQLTVQAATGTAEHRLCAGDVITHISGRPLQPLSYSESVDRLRRAVDPVTLTVARRRDGGAARRGDGGAAKRPADEADGDDVSCGSLEKRLCRSEVGRESVNDLVIGRLTRQLSGDCLATPAGKR